MVGMAVADDYVIGQALGDSFHSGADIADADAGVHNQRPFAADNHKYVVAVKLVNLKYAGGYFRYGIYIDHFQVPPS